MRAIRAVLDRLAHPLELKTDREAWTKHSAKERNFMTWKKQIKKVDEAILNAAGSVALSQQHEATVIAALEQGGGAFIHLQTRGIVHVLNLEKDVVDETQLCAATAQTLFVHSMVKSDNLSSPLKRKLAATAQK